MMRYIGLVDDVLYLVFGKTDKAVNALITFSTLIATLLNMKFQFFPGDFMNALLFFVMLLSIISVIIDDVFEIKIAYVNIGGVQVNRYFILLPIALAFSVVCYYSVIPNILGFEVTTGTRLLLALILGLLSAIYHIVHRFIILLAKEIIEYTGAKFTGYTLVLATLPLFTIFSIKIMYNVFVYIATYYIL